MTKSQKKSLILPALRGIMGNWVYYSCLMSLDELSKRVDYAKDIHKNTHLSDMIQRQLKGDRSAQIASYIKLQPERFFNSLVVATYQGAPNWHALSNVKAKSSSQELNDLSEETIESVGFLTLRGDEKLFALDGQHRLAGIKKAIKEGLDQNPMDEVSVIFVAHKVGIKGLERTRRLFTTLNKTAKPVSKGDIISLDEDDVMAICVRRLIEETKMFNDERIAFVATNNMPVANTTSLTTIGNLYDLLAILFIDAESPLKAKKAGLQSARPADEVLKNYFAYAKSYFVLLAKYCPELKEFFDSKDPAIVVKKHRGSHGGKFLFRPLGLEIFTRIIARLTNEMSLEKAIRHAAKLPFDLTTPPYLGLMWDASNKTISNAHKVTLREVLLHMLGYSKFSEATLLNRFRKETGNDKAQLPEKVV